VSHDRSRWNQIIVQPQWTACQSDTVPSTGMFHQCCDSLKLGREHDVKASCHFVFIFVGTLLQMVQVCIATVVNDVDDGKVKVKVNMYLYSASS